MTAKGRRKEEDPVWTSEGQQADSGVCVCVCVSVCVCESHRDLKRA